jgi:hypothetical protein
MNFSRVFQDIPPLFSEQRFWFPALGGLALWYILAILIAHIAFGSGQEAPNAATLGAWTAVFIVVVGSVLCSVFLWSSAALLVMLGIFLLVIPITLTLFLNRGAKA